MRESLIIDLFNIGCIKFGSFKLKTKVISPIYIDFRHLISYPKILDIIVDLLWDIIKEEDFNLIFGLAYGGIPIASILSNKYKIPMIFNRKEKKTYGCKKIIEGIYSEDSKCIIIDDVFTSGTSLNEGKQILNAAKIKFNNSIFICNRSKNKSVKALFTLNDILSTLVMHQKIDSGIYQKCIDFSNKGITIKKLNINNKVSSNKIHCRLKNIMLSKKSNLVFSSDLTNKDEIINIIHKVGKYICVLKLHSDIIDNFNDEFITNLLKLSNHYNFLLFEDRKYSDIGNTFEKQFYNKLFKVNKWADIITIHCIAGPGILNILRKNNYDKGVILISQMSSKDNLINKEYTSKVIELSEIYSDIVIGLVGQTFENSNAFNFTPGIRYDVQNDQKDQIYNNPIDAVANNTDIFIVGRGIYESENPEKECKKYQMICWESYISQSK